MALPRGSISPEAALCPPFHCRQDEASLTLLLHVPGIQPQSLSGDVGTNHYSLRFSSDTGTYALFLEFPPANRLASPETSVSVSAHNAAIGLAKAPGSTGPWEKFCFGLDASALQKGFHETVPAFPGTLPLPLRLFSAEAMALQHLRVTLWLKSLQTERSKDAICCILTRRKRSVLSVMERKKRLAAQEEIALKRQVATTPKQKQKQTVPQLTPLKENVFSAIPGEAGREEPDLESAVTAGATAVGSEEPAGVLLEGRAKAGGDEAPAGSAQGSRRGSASRAAAPLLREVNAQDGSVRVIGDHVTRCPVVFQNSLLYELD
ncbi:PREDICTED: protein kintoun [Leptosomus discolor]|uniref:protein kintoun n=1 Tax=Leptosomus discolor TaxID=188344 RepID=UPI0005223923|nr:PREDICTED: protein kintoun [Leptosomus discolor]